MRENSSTYMYAGIRFASEIPFPELPTLEVSNFSPQVRIRLATLPVTLEEPATPEFHYIATPSEYLLCIPGIARYLVLHGTEVIVEPDAGAQPLDIRGYLLGTVFAVLCHQRGLLPLHASAISWEGEVIAFLGGSGAGKSSLAANLALRGFPIVADDICVVDPNTRGPAMVIPGAPWLKLWRASLDHLGLPTRELHQVFSDEDKYRLPVNQLVDLQPIRKLIFLEQSSQKANGTAFHEPNSMAAAQQPDGERQPILEEISPVHALPLLMKFTHQPYLPEATGRQKESFLACSRVAAQAEAFRLLRPWGLEYMESAMGVIEKLLRPKPELRGKLQER